MKKKAMIVLGYIFLFVLVSGLGILYYCCPRYVSFEPTTEFQKPSTDFDNSQFIGFNYADTQDKLIYWLVEHNKTIYPPSKQEQSYDSIFVQNLAKELDFQKYDYIITYQKQLKALRHSPYLTKTEDGLYYDKKTPLIPIFDNMITDKVYIYQIKKNNKYRSFGP
jgi:hypothetical protein